MNITSQTDARSLAAVTKVETDRARWLRMYPKVSEEQRSLTNAYFDQAASQVLTQSLADALCAEYSEVC